MEVRIKDGNWKRVHNATAQAYGPRVANIPELLLTTKREETRKGEISLRTGGVGSWGRNNPLKGRRGRWVDPKCLPALLLL
jgi:hypothetical protein